MHNLISGTALAARLLIGAFLVVPAGAQKVGASGAATIIGELDPSKIVLEPWPEPQPILVSPPPPGAIGYWHSGAQAIDPGQCATVNPFVREGSSIASEWSRRWLPCSPTGATDTATLAGSKVLRIVVKQYRGQNWPRPFRSWSEIQKEIQKVWSGQLDAVNSPWSEPVTWNVFAAIEFENSPKRGCLVTDGFHVHLRDVNGQGWFWRIPPPK
jgi:hypothetical protein